MNTRSRARQLAVQALYQWLLTADDIQEIDTQFVVGQDMKNIDVSYFQELLRQSSLLASELEIQITPLLNRKLTEVDPVERAILLISTYELTMRLDIPYRVVINEGVELAKIFGSEQGHRFINGILDKLAKKIRPKEIKTNLLSSQSSESSSFKPSKSSPKIKKKTTIKLKKKRDIQA